MASRQLDSFLRLAERVGLAAAAKGSNFVLSPLSFRAALGLAAAGSNGETLDQMLSFLGSPSLEDLNSASARLVGSLRSGNDGGAALSFANGVWVDRSVGLNPVFIETAASVYGAAAELVDFQNKAFEVRKEVNVWVENMTNGNIKDLLPANSVSHLTRAIIANALYFKGMWLEKFDIFKTRNELFHLLDGTDVEVPFMTSKEDQFISSFDDFEVLRLPYRCSVEDSRSISMLIFLPNNRDGLQNLMQNVTSEPNFINDHIPKWQVAVGKFRIPKFKITFGFEASSGLKDLGLELPFSSAADFTKVVSVSSPQKLCVSGVHHHATIEVEEEGTVATASTGIIAVALCYRPPQNFVADHPFLFVIREDTSGAILFFGHVVNPLLAEHP